MRHPLWLPAFAFLALLCTGVGTASQDASAPLLSVSRQDYAASPGDVVPVVVTASSRIAGLEATAFGAPVYFWPIDGSREWHGLVGIGVDVTPGRYDIELRPAAPGIQAASTRVSVLVQPKRFATRQLRVDTRFVNPPASEMARIEREAKVLAALFSQLPNERLWRGPFSVPVPGRATSSFGRLSVLNGEARGRHQGADFRAAVGTPVRAPNAGKVVLAEDLHFSGNTVVLDHGGGLLSLFAHLSRIAVSAGTMAAQGDVIGEAGATGRVTGPHLHWAARLNGVSVDPLSLIAAVQALPDSRGLLTAR